MQFVTIPNNRNRLFSSSSTDVFFQLWKTIFEQCFIKQEDNTDAESEGDEAGECIS